MYQYTIDLIPRKCYNKVATQFNTFQSRVYYAILVLPSFHIPGLDTYDRIVSRQGEVL